MTDAYSQTLALHRLTALGWSGPDRTPPPQRPAIVDAGSRTWRAASVRTFAAPLPAREAIARLLTEAYSAHGGRRAVPSAGSIYGLNLYIAATVDRLVWMVSADGRLSLLASGGDAVAYSALVYHQIEGPAWLVFITATLAPYIARYGTRGYRYMLLEAGHLGQELIRLSQAAGLRSCPLGAFDDEGVVALIGGRLAGLLPLYILAIGQTEETR